MKTRIGHGVSPQALVQPDVEDDEEDEEYQGPVSPTIVNTQPDWPAVPLRRYVTTSLFILVNAAIFFYWTIVLINTIFTNDYANFTIPPLPGAFVDSRYGWEWWCVFILGFNVFLPFTLQFALLNNDIEEYARLHMWFSTSAMVGNAIIFFILTLLWLASCNNHFSAGASMCNDYRWCGVYFPSAICPNSIPFTPAIVTPNLARNAEASQHWIFCLVFGVLAWWHTSLNGDLLDYGVLH
jgi:hypothetical protein